jgi:hypothetical protein
VPTVEGVGVLGDGPDGMGRQALPAIIMNGPCSMEPVSQLGQKMVERDPATDRLRPQARKDVGIPVPSAPVTGATADL